MSPTWSHHVTDYYKYTYIPSSWLSLQQQVRNTNSYIYCISGSNNLILLPLRVKQHFWGPWRRMDERRCSSILHLGTYGGEWSTMHPGLFNSGAAVTGTDRTGGIWTPRGPVLTLRNGMRKSCFSYRHFRNGSCFLLRCLACSRIVTPTGQPRSLLTTDIQFKSFVNTPVNSPLYTH